MPGQEATPISGSENERCLGGDVCLDAAGGANRDRPKPAMRRLSGARVEDVMPLDPSLLPSASGKAGRRNGPAVDANLPLTVWQMHRYLPTSLTRGLPVDAQVATGFDRGVSYIGGHEHVEGGIHRHPFGNPTKVESNFRWKSDGSTGFVQSDLAPRSAGLRRVDWGRL
ncbi:MAG TPA: hypothetical protein VIP09_10110 [Dehalococcoidia bacterium]